MASGAAVALVQAGCQVVIAEIPNPCSVRRLVSFSEAIYEGMVTVSGILGNRVAADQLRWQSAAVLVAIDLHADQLDRLAPDVIVDARMTKKIPLSLPVTGCPIIGLGPGFVCGKNADLVVETQRGGQLGQVIRQGSAAPYTGVPGKIGGHDTKRVLRAPRAGNLISELKIGDMVDEGSVIGQIDGYSLVSSLTGMLRGLVHPEVELYQGQKVGDVDPRGAVVDPHLQSDKAQAIGAGVWQAVAELCRTKIDREQDGSLS